MAITTLSKHINTHLSCLCVCVCAPTQSDLSDADAKEIGFGQIYCQNANRMCGQMRE